MPRIAPLPRHTFCTAGTGGQRESVREGVERASFFVPVFLSLSLSPFPLSNPMEE